MQPLITEPPFQKALEDLKLLMSEPGQLELTPAQVYQNVLTGQAAIGVTWPGKHVFDETVDTETSPANVGFTAIPGSRKWFDSQSKKWNLRPKEDSQHVDLIGFSGLVASVSKSSRNTKWAFKFLEWLSSKSISLITVVESPRSGPFRASHLGDPTRWTDSRISDEAAHQYAEVIRNCHNQTIVFLFPRLPGREEYLEVLDRHVRECLEGKLEPVAALELVAEQWETITEEKGRQLQISQLRRDAGL
jgi:ABC-type glycerol-3-phosphate transport system substrate-binding protein